jgi:hypothetical protein
VIRPLAALGLGAALFVLLLLSHVHFPNDHFVHLSCAAQMLAGDLPTRDFADPGMPLMYAASASAQWIGRRTLLAEAILVYGALATGAGLLAYGVARLTGSTLLGSWAGICAGIIGARPYSYPKILLYAAAVYVFARGARMQSAATPILLGVLVAVAFLFRHDHGLFIGAASGLFVAAAGEGRSRDRARRLAWCFGVAAALVLPYLAFVHVHRGLGAYVASAARFSREEAERTRLTSWMPPLRNADPRASAAAGLFYGFWALPIAATLVAARSKSVSRDAVAAVGAVSALAIAANGGFLRDRLEDRIADAVVPAAALAAFLAGLLARPRPPSTARRLASAVAIAGLICFAVAAAWVGRFPEAVARSQLTRGPAAMASRGRQLAAELLQPRAAPQMPSAVSLALLPFFDYVEACTRPNDTLFVPGFAPEVPYFARRRFAGGHVTLPGDYYSSDEEQRRIGDVLQRQSVPIVVLPPGSKEILERHHPRVSAWLGRYVPVASYLDHQGRTTEVRVRSGLPAVRIHDSGLPCYR